MHADLRFGRWQDVLSDVVCDALVFDAPYSSVTHGFDQRRADGCDPSGLRPEYDAFTPDDIRAFCEFWARRTSGWWVSLTDSVLEPSWRAEMERVGRCTFAPVPCVVRGMTVRLSGDGPSSWTIWAAVSRPRSREFATWGTLDGAYIGPAERGAGGGRGKPRWLMDALIRDYTRPGDLVCDPFAGWGTTLAAAIGLGRRAVGAEMDPDAFAEAQRRVGRPQQMDLLEAVR